MRDPISSLSKPMLGLAAVTLLLGAGPAAAHHSFALFDVTKTVMLDGKVKEFEWTNPHSWIHLVVTGADNRPEEWLIELPAAASLARDGWGKNYVKTGDHLSVRINPLKNGMKGGSLQSFRPEKETP
jgi:hypothetical protein